MKNNSYWEKRLANDLWNTYNDTSKYQKELIEIYKKATDEILEELYRIASKYEENGVISRSEFYKAEHLKRMEKGFNDVLKGLGEKIENKGSKIILNAGEDVVKKTGKSLGIDINYNEDLAKKLMQTEWKGSNFSKRIWRNSKKLERELNTQVKKGILTGKPTAQIAMELNKSMGSGLSNSARLIRTETMHHMNDINLAHMKDSGISKVKEIVTLDERTSSTLRSRPTRALSCNHPFGRSLFQEHTTSHCTGQSHPSPLTRRPHFHSLRIGSFQSERSAHHSRSLSSPSTLYRYRLRTTRHPYQV